MADTFKPLNLKRPDIYLAAMPKCTMRDTGIRASLPAPIEPHAPMAKPRHDIYAAAVEELAN